MVAAVRWLLGTACWLGSLLIAQDPARGASALDVSAGDARVADTAVRAVHELAQTALSKLARTFPGTPLRPIRVIVHRDQESLSPAQRAHLHPGTAGFALLGRDETHILLDEAVRQPPNDLRTVVTHELAHVLLDQSAGAAGPWLPRWLHEGLAQTLSGGPYLGVQEESLLFAVASRTAPRFTQLEREFPERDDLLRLAYAQSWSFVAFLTDKFGTHTIIEAAQQSSAGKSFGKALLDATDLSLARLQEEWEDHVLFGSGAAARYLLRNCFAFVIILAVPLLVIAAVKRVRSNRLRKEQLAAAERVSIAPNIATHDDDEGEVR
jgi:hypothetical protein